MTNDSLKDFRHETAGVNGVNLHYVIGGAGEPLLLWHGFLETWYCWRKVMSALAEKYTVIAPDMRGFGDSDKPEKGYDGQTLAEDFRALIRHLGFEQKQISIVAFDMGAPPALLYAGQYPDEVRGLVYLDEPVITQENIKQAMQFTPEGTRNGGLWWWQFALAADMPERLIIGREREFLMWFYENYTFERTSIDEDAINEYLRTFAAPGGVKGAFGVYRQIFETMEQTEPFHSYWNKSSVPVLGLGGEKSIGEKTKMMLESVASKVSGSAIERCGHFIAEERPEYLIEQITKFFDGI